MAKIKLLDQYTANHIAAGEVVERPASIVKELVENSVDAGSTAVTVEIKGGGIALIRVADNGCGIEAEDVEIAFLRHATSKIATHEDLAGIATLGFRGEALSSIAAVSQVELVTRTPKAEMGSRLSVQGGKVIDFRPVGSPDGTTITVSNVFYNTPARLKFLKKPSIEAGYVGDYISRIILAHPELSIKYICEGKTVYHSPGDGKLETAMFCVYGSEVARSILDVNYGCEDLKISGYISSSALTRPNRTYQSFFVNGRYVQSALLSSALHEAYGTRLMGGRFPLCALEVTLPYIDVDVNIHPNKLTVRFSDENRIAQALRTAADAALGNKRMPDVNPAQSQYDEPANPIAKPEQSSMFKTSFFDDKPQAAKPIKAPSGQPPERPSAAVPSPSKEELKQTETKQVTNRQARTASKPSFSFSGIDDSYIRKIAPPEAEAKQPLFVRQMSGPAYKSAVLEEPLTIIGQAFLTYVLVQKADTLYIIDQHAAHERAIYDSLIKKTAPVGSQQLLIPFETLFSPLELSLYEENKELLMEMGFEVAVGNDSVASVRAVPVIFEEAEAADFLHDVLNADKQSAKNVTIKLKYETLAQYACKHAVRGRQSLSAQDLSALLDSYKELGELNCPHGRPIVMGITKRQIDKVFMRVL